MQARGSLRGGRQQIHHPGQAGAARGVEAGRVGGHVAGLFDIFRMGEKRAGGGTGQCDPPPRVPGHQVARRKRVVLEQKIYDRMALAVRAAVQVRLHHRGQAIPVPGGAGLPIGLVQLDHGAGAAGALAGAGAAGTVAARGLYSSWMARARSLTLAMRRSTCSWASF